jgi:predicted alpha/beta-fold hydrolase
VAILLHGWEGSSRSVHTLSLATVLLAQGIRTVRLNLRDHGNSHHLNRDLFHSCRLQEVVDALGVIVKRVAPAPCVAVGFSLGGSFVLRAACDAHIGMKAAIAICPPLNPAQSMVQLQTGSLVYKHYFLRKWNRSLAIKRAAWPEVYNEQNLPQGQNLTDMTENLVARYTDYPSVADYFKGYAIIGERLQDLQIPATLVLAEDDPIIPIADSDRLPLHPQLRVIKQRRGGHCGFLEHLNGEAWIDGRVAKAILNVTRSS